MRKISVLLFVLLLAGAGSASAQRGSMQRNRMNTMPDSTIMRMRTMRHDSMMRRRMPSMRDDSMMMRGKPGMWRDSMMMRRMNRSGMGMMNHRMYQGAGFGMRHPYMHGYYGGGMDRRMNPMWGSDIGMARPYGGMRMFENIPGLTDKQKTEIEDLRANQQAEMQKLRDQMSDKMAALRKSHRENIMNILTPDQKKWVEDHMKQ
ncbi:MAG: hypothetical protein WCE64_02775 [Bacteroidales bacterium]